jgi:competence protein ComGC
MSMMTSAIPVIIVFSIIFILIVPQQELISVRNVVTDKYTDTEAVFLSGSRTAYYLEINNSNVTQVDIEAYNRYDVNDSIMQYKTVNHDSLGIQFLKFLHVIEG